MLNQVILVGRLVNDPELVEKEDGTKVTTVTLGVQRNYKNPDTGEYDTDFITATLWHGIAESTVEYCKKGTTIGIKARLNSDDGLKVIAEKVTFINTSRD